MAVLERGRVRRDGWNKFKGREFFLTEIQVSFKYINVLGEILNPLDVKDILNNLAQGNLLIFKGHISPNYDPIYDVQ